MSEKRRKLSIQLEGTQLELVRARMPNRRTAERWLRFRRAEDESRRFLERFHGVDERVGVEALRWGLPVLYDVVATYCG